jgi:hypothetical protein
VEIKRKNVFLEIKINLPLLTKKEKEGIKRELRYNQQTFPSQLFGSTVAIVATSLLLALLGFMKPPCKLMSTNGISLKIEEPTDPLYGLIIVLTFNELWDFSSDLVIQMKLIAKVETKIVVADDV